MNRNQFHIILWLFLFTLYDPIDTLAQSSIFVPSYGQVFAHPGKGIGIFGNVINNGNFGSTPGSLIHFMGQKWKNTTTATLAGNDGIGGTIIFSGDSLQTLGSGYHFQTKTGPAFPHLTIDNPSGVQLQDLNDLHIRGNLHFQKGYLILNNRDARIDDSITGYSDQAFVITGKNIGGGSLYRSSPPSIKGVTVFPIGTDINSYSPIALKTNTAIENTVGARVFNHVYLNATYGNVIDSSYVKKTWKVSSLPRNKSTILLLQHDEDDEGTLFSYYRDSSYISQYHPIDGYWDRDSLLHQTIHPGTLTTMQPGNFDYINNRSFPNGIPSTPSDTANYFSLSTSGSSNRACPIAHFQLWTAKRYNANNIQLFWRTNFEQNVMKYEVQRRIDTGLTYKRIAIIDGQGRDGFSDQMLYYYAKDEKAYDGWIYYRLKLISKSGCISFTEEQSVSWSIDLKVWPNPSHDGNVQIKVSGIIHPIQMQLIDDRGKILYQYRLNNKQTIHLPTLSAAVYLLIFRDPKKDNHKIKTTKLVIQ